MPNIYSEIFCRDSFKNSLRSSFRYFKNFGKSFIDLFRNSSILWMFFKDFFNNSSKNSSRSFSRYFCLEKLLYIFFLELPQWISTQNIVDLFFWNSSWEAYRKFSKDFSKISSKIASKIFRKIPSKLVLCIAKEFPSIIL